MKAALPLLVLWLLTTDLFGQSDTHLTFGVSPISTYRRLSYTNKQISSSWARTLDSLDNPFFGGKIQFDISHQFRNGSRMSAAIGYKKVGKTITRQYWIYETDPENPLVIPSPDDYYIQKFVEKESYNYLTLSLFFGHNIGLNEKLSITPTIGTSLDYLLSYDTRYEDEIVDYNRLVLVGTIKVQFEYIFSERWRFQLAPLYGQSFTPNITAAYEHDDRQYADLLDFEVKQYSYYYGVELGVAFKIKNRS